MLEAIDDSSPSHHPQLERSDSNLDLYEQVDTFEEKEEVDVLEEMERYHSEEGKQPEETNSHPHQSSTDTGTSTSDTYFICSDWVSRISIKRLKYQTRQFYLPSAILKPGPNDRSHTHPPRMAAFSEAII